MEGPGHDIEELGQIMGIGVRKLLSNKPSTAHRGGRREKSAEGGEGGSEKDSFLFSSLVRGGEGKGERKNEGERDS